MSETADDKAAELGVPLAATATGPIAADKPNKVVQETSVANLLLEIIHQPTC
jgi:hypothetical protein